MALDSFCDSTQLTDILELTWTDESLALGPAGGCLGLAEPSRTVADLATESAEQKDVRMRWWREARFGMFIHWGLYSLPAGEWKGQRMAEIREWIMSNRIPITEYSQLTQRFNPIKFDANAVVSLAKDAGIRYLRSSQPSITTVSRCIIPRMTLTTSTTLPLSNATPWRNWRLPAGSRS